MGKQPGTAAIARERLLWCVMADCNRKREMTLPARIVMDLLLWRNDGRFQISRPPEAI